MIAFLASVGAAFLAFLAAAGRLALFAGQALGAALRPPYYPRLILRQIVDIGYFSLPVVGLTAIFTGMVLALQSYTGFSRFTAESAIATVVVLSVTRELGPVIAGLMVAGRIGAAMAAEIGTMRVTDQIDALTTLSTNPLQISGGAAPPRRARDAAGAGPGRRHHRRVRRLSRRRPTSSTSTRRPISTQTDRLSAQRRRGLGPDQSGGVRLHRRADGLLSRLSFARRRAGRGRGDDLCGGLGLDPDPAVRLHPDPGVLSRDEHAAPRSQDRRPRAREILRPQASCSTASTSTCAAGESLVVIGGSGTGQVGAGQMHPRADAARCRLDQDRRRGDDRHRSRRARDG